MDNGFAFADITTLWEASELSGLEDPNSLYYSMPSLTKCMERISTTAQSLDPNSAKSYQFLLSKLFVFLVRSEK